MKKLIGMVVFVLLVSTFSYSSNVDAKPGAKQVLRILRTIKLEQGCKGCSWSERLHEKISGFFEDSGEKSGTVIQECGCWGKNYPLPSHARCESGYVHAVRCKGSCSRFWYEQDNPPYKWVCD